MIEFFVPMIPVGKARARVTVRGTYTPQKTVDAERLIGWEAKKAMGGMKPLEGALWLTVTSWFPMPKSLRRKRPKHKTTKPDVDNVVKLVKDALNKIAWVDDAQIVELRAVKGYAPLEPGVHISFGPMT